MEGGHHSKLWRLHGRELDQKSMTPAFRDMFNAEVEGKGFQLGHGRSFIVTGMYADANVKAAWTCLRRGEYPAAHLDTVALVRRLRGEWVPSWTEDDDAILEDAETIILQRFFLPRMAEALSPREQLDLVWFIVNAVTDGKIIILPMTKDVDLDFLGEDFGEFLEQQFEVFDSGTATETQSKAQTSKTGIKKRTRKP